MHVSLASRSSAAWGCTTLRCEHAYAHNSLSKDFHAFPGQLKGADAALFALCAGLGLATRVAPINVW